MGDCEARAPAFVESLLGYHSLVAEILTCARYPGGGQCQVGSLTGAVASKRVTEALKGQLSTAGNRAFECKRVSWPNCEGDGPSSNESWS